MNTSMLLLYIDPGTGSMLFSIIIGAAATLFFLAKAAWLKIKVLFAGKKAGSLSDSSHKNFVIYNEGKQYQNTFIPILDEFEKRHIEVTYYTSFENDICFEKNYTSVKPEFIGEGNKAIARLNMLSADIVLMTTPGLQVYQLKRSRNVKHYCHIVHMTTDTTTYRLFGLDYFDSVLLTGDYQAKDIRILEKQRDLPEKELVTVGCPYLDELKKKLLTIPEEENHSFTVLVSPSWGSQALLSRFGEKLLDPLANTGWNIIIRPHPQSLKSEKDLLDNLQLRYKDNDTISWDFNSDNIYSLKKADIMISDFSGIIFDYTFLLNKPVMYVKQDMDLRMYDAYDIEEGKTLWEFNVLNKFGVEIDENQFSDIKNVITSLSENEQSEKERTAACNEAWFHKGHSAEKVVDFMISHSAL